MKTRRFGNYLVEDSAPRHVLVMIFTRDGFEAARRAHIEKIKRIERARHPELKGMALVSTEHAWSDDGATVAVSETYFRQRDCMFQPSWMAYMHVHPKQLEALAAL